MFNNCVLFFFDSEIQGIQGIQQAEVNPHTLAAIVSHFGENFMVSETSCCFFREINCDRNQHVQCEFWEDTAPKKSKIIRNKIHDE